MMNQYEVNGLNRTLFAYMTIALVFVVVMGTMTLVRPVAAVLDINPSFNFNFNNCWGPIANSTSIANIRFMW
jgi:hypothetical protein